jgi:hypothetical protein
MSALFSINTAAVGRFLADVPTLFCFLIHRAAETRKVQMVYLHHFWARDTQMPVGAKSC